MKSTAQSTVQPAEPFPTMTLIGFGQMLGKMLGQPLEKAVALSPDKKVVATRDGGSFDVTEEVIRREDPIQVNVVRETEVRAAAAARAKSPKAKVLASVR
ncbi:MAG: hypothetical protein HC771_12030 [Synechococcales cyanobacterium CRU_2_2]|nr:hypothetical protein [Synechococcales cyanobacterium CRU_2_2]